VCSFVAFGLWGGLRPFGATAATYFYNKTTKLLNSQPAKSEGQVTQPTSKASDSTNERSERLNQRAKRVTQPANEVSVSTNEQSE